MVFREVEGVGRDENDSHGRSRRMLYRYEISTGAQQRTSEEMVLNDDETGEEEIQEIFSVQIIEFLLLGLPESRNRSPATKSSVGELNPQPSQIARLI